MPSRVLRDYTDSLKFDGISADAERLWVRILTKADDYGRYHAEPRLVRAGCFPLSDNLRTNDLARWLDELSTRQLILRYETQGRHLLAIINFRQRLKKSRAKFAAPDGKPAGFLPESDKFPELPGDSGKFPPEAEADLDSDLEAEADSAATAGAVPETEDAHIPTPEEVVTAGTGPGVPPDYCRNFHDKTSEKRMWLNPHGKLVDWRKQLVRFWRADQPTWRGNGAAPPKPPAAYLKTEWPEWLKAKGQPFVEYSLAAEFMRSDFHKERKAKKA